MKSPCYVLALSLSLLCFSGCGGSDDPDRYKVKGTVTYDGKPLEKGSIILDPADGKGGAAAGGIENGAFEFEAEPGKKIVRISANRETGEKDQYGEIVTESYIPEKYNSKSTLNFTVEAKEVNEYNPNLDK